MGKVIKVIDLLNMIAKGGRLPQKIKFLQEEYRLTVPLHDYKTIHSKYLTGEIHNFVFWYNIEVEILDEEDEIDIQKISELTMAKSNGDYDEYSIGANRQIINNLVKAVKKLDNKLKEK